MGGVELCKTAFYLCYHVVENVKQWFVLSLVFHKILSKKSVEVQVYNDRRAMLPVGGAVLSQAVYFLPATASQGSK